MCAALILPYTRNMIKTEFAASIGKDLHFTCPWKLTDWVLEYRGTEDVSDVIDLVQSYGERMVENEEYELLEPVHELYDKLLYIQKTGLEP